MVLHHVLKESFSKNAKENTPRGLSSAESGAGAKKLAGKTKTKHSWTPLTVKIDGKTFTTRSAFDTFWQYASERHAVEEKRRAGEPRPWSSKSVFEEYKFCSVFRVADRGCQFLIKEVIEKGSQAHEEILFRVLLYSSFVRVETYELLERTLGPLTWKEYHHTRYAEVLKEAINNGDSIYTGAFQKFPPHLGYSYAHDNHLALIEVMMGNGFLEQLKSCEYMADAFDVIYKYPGSGDFVAFQLLINLSYTPLVNFNENDFVIAGVGAVKGLRKCFSPLELVSGSEPALIRWMANTQMEHYERLGLKPALLGKEKRGMSLVDVEHTLCELHKYLRITGGGGTGTGYGKRFTLKTRRMPRWATLPAAWSHPARLRSKPKPGRTGAQRAEKVYVVRGILERGETEDGEVMYYVDWVGYPTTARTWEPAEDLVLDAPDMVEEYERTHPRPDESGPKRKRRRM